jgi:hypothetical protein
MIAAQGMRDYRLSQTLNHVKAKPFLNMLKTVIVLSIGFAMFLLVNVVDRNYDATIAGAKFIYAGSVQKNESISATVYSTRSNVHLTKTWPKQFDGSFNAPGWATGDAPVGAEIAPQAVSGAGARNYAIMYHELPSDPWYVRLNQLLTTALVIIGLFMFIFALCFNTNTRIET